MNNATSKGVLFLIPNVLADDTANSVIPSQVKEIASNLNHFVVENAKITRHYLKSIGYPLPLNDLVLFELNKHTDLNELQSFIAPLQKGINMGLISDAGCPGVADPGADIVKLCHQKNIKVVPLVGPSSILMSLMASGLNGQSFAFIGYLPKENTERVKKLKALEKFIYTSGQTQLFIETPFRNNQLLEDLLKNCDEQLKLCIAVDITAKNEWIATKPISIWKKDKPDINKRQAIFLLGK